MGRTQWRGDPDLLRRFLAVDDDLATVVEGHGQHAVDKVHFQVFEGIDGLQLLEDLVQQLGGAHGKGEFRHSDNSLMGSRGRAPENRQMGMMEQAHGQIKPAAGAGKAPAFGCFHDDFYRHLPDFLSPRQGLD